MQMDVVDHHRGPAGWAGALPDLNKDVLPGQEALDVYLNIIFPLPGGLGIRSGTR
jgi:hypothetical protein